MRIRQTCSAFFIAFFGIMFLPGTPISAGTLQRLKTSIKNQEQLTKSFRTRGSGVYRQREIIVKFKERTRAEVVQELNQKYGTGVLSKNDKRNVHRMRTPGNFSVENMLSLYRENKNVEYAEPNYTVYATMVPNDTYYGFQWHLDNPQSGGIHVESAWDMETGNPDVIVAVLDTGVAYEDYGRYKKASDFVDTRFVQGYDFVNQDAHPNDDNGHGTHVTGTIAQSTNNSLGVAGIAFQVSIMPVKVLDANGEGSHATVSEGIYYAADHGANVINLSLGSTDASNTLRDAIAYAYGKGVTIVAAAGNDGNDAVDYPAAYDDYVIAVGAARFDETRTDYSNFGTSIDIMAPGGDMSVDQNNDGYPDGILQQTFSGHPSNFGYWLYEGTSMATSHVTGVAALVLSSNAMVPAQVCEVLEMTARDKGDGGWDAEYGWGLVDAAAAVRYSPLSIHEVGIAAVTVASTVLIGDLVPIDVMIKNAGNFDEEVTVELREIPTETILGIQTIALASHSAETVSFDWTTAGLSADSYAFSIDLSGIDDDRNLDNNQSSFSITLLDPKHDISLSAFNVPLQASQGTSITLCATIENAGTYNETGILSLLDRTSGETIGNTSFSLNAGEIQTVSCVWDTTTASLGTHQLEAQLEPVPGEIAVEDNVLLQDITITEPVAEETIHVELSSLWAESNRGQFRIRAYLKNLETSSETVTVTCAVISQDGTPITDTGLADKQVTLPAGYRGIVTWYGSTRLLRGTYTVNITIPEAGQEKSCVFRARS